MDLRVAAWMLDANFEKVRADSRVDDDEGAKIWAGGGERHAAFRRLG